MVNDPNLTLLDSIAEVVASIRSLIDNIGKVIVGKQEEIELVIAALLARGHVLLEDRPGVGKTMLARALAASIGCTYKRIQCTPDLLPVDVTGYIDPRNGQFKRGPLFANIVLADELNRATERTQSALLEAMAESHATIDGVEYPLVDPVRDRSGKTIFQRDNSGQLVRDKNGEPRPEMEPFFIIATQNPVEHRGVNDLPEAQLDRFQMMLTLGYPSRNDEKRMMVERQKHQPLDRLNPVIDIYQLWTIINFAATRVRISDGIIDYILDIVGETRKSDDIELGASPRCSLYLMALARSYALVNGRDYVVPDDIKKLAKHSLPHRIIPAIAPTEMESSADLKRKCIRRTLDKVKPPVG
jgi:MoxR-like ATPase